MIIDRDAAEEAIIGVCGPCSCGAGVATLSFASLKHLHGSKLHRFNADPELFFDTCIVLTTSCISTKVLDCLDSFKKDRVLTGPSFLRKTFDGSHAEETECQRALAINGGGALLGEY